MKHDKAIGTVAVSGLVVATAVFLIARKIHVHTPSPDLLVGYGALGVMLGIAAMEYGLLRKFFHR